MLGLLLLGFAFKINRAAWLLLPLLMGSFNAWQVATQHEWWQNYFQNPGYAELEFTWDEDTYISRETDQRSGWAWVSPVTSGALVSHMNHRLWVRVIAVNGMSEHAFYKGARHRGRFANPGGQIPRSLVFSGTDLETRPMSLAWKLRAHVIERFEKGLAINTGDHPVDFLRALLTGNRKGMRAQWLHDFQRLNLMHLLALSGLHVGILFFVCVWALKRLRFDHFIIMGLALLVVVSYGFLGGWAFPLKRAVGMCALAIFALFLGRRYRDARWNILFCIALVELVFQPEALTSVSFLLSYLGVGGIFWSITIIPISHQHDDPRKKKGWANRASRSALNTYVASWGAILFTWPVAAWCFGVIPTWSWLSSVPLILLFTPVLMISLLCSLLSLALVSIPDLLWWPIQTYIDTVQYFSHLNAWVDSGSPGNPLWLSGYYMALIGLWAWAFFKREERLSTARHVDSSDKLSMPL